MADGDAHKKELTDMGIMESLVLLLVFLLGYMAIIEIFTVLFRLTGLTREKARTQVISMLTNSGFTTSESELIMASRRRRKLAWITMLFGYSFSVIIVSIIVNIFFALSRTEMNQMVTATAIATVIFLVLLLVLRLKSVQSGFDHIIEKLGNRMMFGNGSNAIVAIDTYGGKAMVEIHLKFVPEMLEGKRLEDTPLRREYGIQVLFIKRGGLAIQKIDGNVELHASDIVFLFGDHKNIRMIFEHPGAHTE